MKDNLERFVDQNRTGFDDLEPSDQLWGKIQKELKPEKNYQWVWKVAAVVLLAVTVGLLTERSFKNGYESDEIALQVPSELVEAEQFYVRTISLKRQEIQALIDDQQLSDLALLEDIDQLDEMYDLLKKDLKSNQNNEKLINAMIQNLQLRVEILNKQLKILEKLNTNYENEEVII